MITTETRKHETSIENTAKNAIMETSKTMNELLKEIFSLDTKEREELLAQWRAANV